MKPHAPRAQGLRWHLLVSRKVGPELYTSATGSLLVVSYLPIARNVAGQQGPL